MLYFASPFASSTCNSYPVLRTVDVTSTKLATRAYTYKARSGRRTDKTAFCIPPSSKIPSGMACGSSLFQTRRQNSPLKS
ncbi:hypothetical protein V8C43DRAFT_289330 [Trichoderma afarasin]